MDLLNQVNLASYEEEWLLIPDELEFIDGDAETSEDSLFAIGPGGYHQELIMMARSDRIRENRWLAIEELAHRNIILINHTVTEIALFDDDARVKKFAHDVLEGKLGDQLAEYLADFQKTWDGTEADPNDESSGLLKPCMGGIGYFAHSLFRRDIQLILYG